MMLYYQTKFGSKQTSSLEDIVKIVTFFLSPCCDLDIEDSEPVFVHDTLPHDNTPHYQIWLKMVVQFRRYRLGQNRTLRTTDGQLDTRTHRQTDGVTPIYNPTTPPPPYVYRVVGGGGYKKKTTCLHDLDGGWGEARTKPLMFSCLKVIPSLCGVL